MPESSRASRAQTQTRSPGQRGAGPGGAGEKGAGVGKMGSSVLMGALAQGPVQMKGAGAEVVQRKEHTSPDTVLTAESVDEAATSDTVVQKTDHDSPTSGPIAGIMTTAGIASFGPFVWDDTAPRFKVNPAYTTWTIADCVNTAKYEPESKAVAGEKGNKNSLITSRRTAAMKAVFGITKGIVESILAHDNGLTPRPVASIAAEDTASGGHTVERHILGQGLMTGNRQVALRAAFWKVAGVKMDLDPLGTASVFQSDAIALTALQNFVTNELTTNWATHRVSLANNTQVKLPFPNNVATVAYTKRDAPIGAPYADTDMPKYIDNAAAGDRQLYTGDYAGAGRPTDANAPDTGKPTLTVPGPVTYPNVYIVVDPNKDAPGGWAIYTMYPKL